MRTTYKNGHPITLVQCGCDGCTPATINGKICHERGCPDAWRDTPKTCYECGFEFFPDQERNSPYGVCNDCTNQLHDFSRADAMASGDLDFDDEQEDMEEEL